MVVRRGDAASAVAEDGLLLLDPTRAVVVVEVLVHHDLEARGVALLRDDRRPGEEEVPDAVPALAVRTDDGIARVRYVAPGALAREARVVAVRLWLRIRADVTEPGFEDDTALNYANVRFTPTPFEARQRRVLVERTIALRNVRQ